MKIVRARAYARIGLLENPSDGYFGKTISTIIRNFSARVVVYEWPELEILLTSQDRCQFSRIGELVEDVQLNGLYGGLRLIKAAIKVFAEQCQRRDIDLPPRNFSLRYDTDIPRQVGLAGSSAIVAAVFRALMDFYDISIPDQELASLVLQVETDEIGITAGLQDRVCQVYGGLVYMDFDRAQMERHGYGNYERLDPSLLPPLYVAFKKDLSQISGIYHGNLRNRWESGDSEVIEGISQLASLAKTGKECLLQRDYKLFDELINTNFDLRTKLLRLDPANMEMVELARSLGVSAKYAGSGGSVVGVCEGEELFSRLQNAFAQVGCMVVRPQVGCS